MMFPARHLSKMGIPVTWFIRIFASVLLVLFQWSVGAQGVLGNLVQNGSFEDLGPNYTSLSPWKGSVSIYWDFPTAVDGTNFVAIPNFFFQDIPTVAGQGYRFRFAFGGNEAAQVNNAPLGVFWDGKQFASVSVALVPVGLPQWRYLTYQVVATSSTTRIGFAPVGSVGAEAFPYVDDVSVVAIPEPSTASMIALMLMGRFVLCAGRSSKTG